LRIIRAEANQSELYALLGLATAILVDRRSIDKTGRKEKEVAVLFKKDAFRVKSGAFSPAARTR